MSRIGNGPMSLFTKSLRTEKPGCPNTVIVWPLCTTSAKLW